MSVHVMSNFPYITKALVCVALIIITISTFANAQTAEFEIAEAYLAKSNDEGKAGERSTIFSPNDIPIFCVVRMSDVGKQLIKMDLIAVNVSGVKAESKIVSTAYTTAENEDRVNFTGRPHGKWISGKYRADIFVGGVLKTSLDFEIRSSAMPATSNSFVKKPSAKPAPRRTRKN